jgi:hypothetical protein
MNVPSILSAIYAPYEGGQTATTIHNEDPIASTRDVTLQVRALLALAMRRHDIDDDNDDDKQLEGTTTTPHPKKPHHPSRIVILDGKYDGGMNVLFGDPVPGTSKRLEIRYVYDGRLTPVHTASFAEHEEVVLAKRFILHNNDDDGGGDGDGSSMEEDQNKESATTTTLATSSNASKAVIALPSPSSSFSSSSSCSWTLSHTVSEMVLPYALEFLDLRERVRCRTVCSAWRAIIEKRGVAVRIDDGDTTTFPIATNQNNTTSTQSLQFHSILIGLLANSHASLTSLALSGTPHVAADIVHIALPHLRRLASLDISRCVYLGSDETLRLLAVCGTRDTLRVLYLKGPLPGVTSAGLIDVVSACRKIRVLDISYLTQLGDESMAAIGRYLTQLRSLFLRDNFRITSTNDIVVAARNDDDDDSDVHQYQQPRLEQLTVWGCTGLRQLRLGSAETLAVVNLWGCHSLRDDAADAFRDFAALRSLSVAECHRLTDEFVVRR